MKINKLIAGTALGATLIFGLSGCTGNSLNLNSQFGGETEVIKVFKKGYIVKVQKVLVNDRKLATLTGAGIGGATGLLAKGSKAKGAVIGAVAGAVIGAIVGTEVEAWQTIIEDESGNKHTTYLKHNLQNGAKVEFVLRKKDQISNVNVIG